MSIHMATTTASYHPIPTGNDAMGARTVPIITPTIKMSPSSPVPDSDPMDITVTSAPSTSETNLELSSPGQSPKSPVEQAAHAKSMTNGAGFVNGTTRSNGIGVLSRTPRGGSPVGGGSPPGSNTSSMNPQGSIPISAVPPAPAAAVTQQKIVQTAFIHKLYNMLEDSNITHLIKWTDSGDGFTMVPSADFSKVLAQYFKHTNVSSFVRQLNMYGFHKVSDVFNPTGSDANLWEFRHGNGYFKRGDYNGLREIKRRASRHALVPQSKATSQPGTPSEAMPMPEGQDRLVQAEHSLYDMGARLQRCEESLHMVMSRYTAMAGLMSKSLRLNADLAGALGTLAPPEHHVQREVAALQQDVRIQIEQWRAFEQEPLPEPVHYRAQIFSQVENAPVSPRQMAQDDPRRLAVPRPGYHNNYRPQVPSNLSLSTRRPYGSMAAGSTPPQPSPHRAQPQLPPPGPHPRATAESAQPNLARRHTAADIRAHGWQPSQSSQPSGAGPSLAPISSAPSQWPPSPSRPSHGAEDPRLQESLSSYSLQGASHRVQSRPTTPPLPPFSNGHGNGNASHQPPHQFPSHAAPLSQVPPSSNGAPSGNPFDGWSWNSASRRDDRDGRSLTVGDSSMPPTRRGSMAHILNHDSGDPNDPRGDEDRKRKRLL